MKNDYTQAFLGSIDDGMSVDEALVGLQRVLAKKSHTKLLVSILHDVLRVLKTEKNTKQAVVTVASEKTSEQLQTQIATVLKNLGVKKEVGLKEVVDETLIGGFVATFDYKEHDQSYKKALKLLYESITK